MTAKQAKKITIKVWSYLAKHPEIQRKDELPRSLYSKIENCRVRCSLCEYQSQIRTSPKKLLCLGCPLKKKKNGLYICAGWDLWINSDCGKSGEEDRIKGAKEIVRRVTAWKV